MLVFDCGGEKRLRFYLNERPTHVAGCPKGACTSSDFINYYSGKANQDFGQVCKTDKSEGEHRPLLIIISIPRKCISMEQRLISNSNSQEGV